MGAKLASGFEAWVEVLMALGAPAGESCLRTGHRMPAKESYEQITF